MSDEPMDAFLEAIKHQDVIDRSNQIWQFNQLIKILEHGGKNAGIATLRKLIAILERQETDDANHAG